MNSVALHTVSSFKGLEADGVNIIVPTKRDNLAAQIYVGISRARCYLNILAPEEMRQELAILFD